MKGELGPPGMGIDARDLIELRLAEVHAGPVDVPVARRCAEGVFFAVGRAFDSADHPLQNAHVFTIAGPDELAIGPFAEPVDAVDPWQPRAALLELGSEIEPMLKVV